MIKEFNPLRAILIIFIFLHHRGVWDGAGGMAVACFFVLGGFCSALGYVDKVRRPDFHYGQYLVGRLVKQNLDMYIHGVKDELKAKARGRLV